MVDFRSLLLLTAEKTDIITTWLYGSCSHIMSHETRNEAVCKTIGIMFAANYFNYPLSYLTERSTLNSIQWWTLMQDWHDDVFRQISIIYCIMMFASVFSSIPENAHCQSAFDIVILAHHLSGVCPGFLPRVLFLWNYCYFCELYCYFCEFIVIFVNFILIFVNYFYVSEKNFTQ